MAPTARKKLEIVWICVYYYLISLVCSDQEPEDYVYINEDNLPLFAEEDYESDEYDYYYGIVDPQIRGNTNFPSIRDVSKT